MAPHVCKVADLKQTHQRRELFCAKIEWKWKLGMKKMKKLVFYKISYLLQPTLFDSLCVSCFGPCASNALDLTHKHRRAKVNFATKFSQLIMGKSNHNHEGKTLWKLFFITLFNSLSWFYWVSFINLNQFVYFFFS